MLTSLFDGAADLVGAVLGACFGIVPSLPLAIVLTSALAGLAVAPLTVRGVRLARLHSRLQPRITELRSEHTGDPAALRAATRDLFRSEGTSPFAPVALGLLQAPVPFVVYRLVRGLLHRGANGLAAPRHVGAAIARAVSAGGLSLGGVDLTTSAVAALHGPPAAGLIVGVFAAVILLVALAQREIGRRAHLAVAARPHPAVELVGRLTPVAALAWGLLMPLALAVSLTTMGAVRVGVLWLVERRPPSA
jgi:YidC/Oxa1 family membrane protein insertase